MKNFIAYTRRFAACLMPIVFMAFYYNYMQQWDTDGLGHIGFITGISCVLTMLMLLARDIINSNP